MTFEQTAAPSGFVVLIFEDQRATFGLMSNAFEALLSDLRLQRPTRKTENMATALTHSGPGI